MLQGLKKWLLEQPFKHKRTPSSCYSHVLNVQEKLFDRLGFFGMIDKLQTMAITAPQDALNIVENLLNYVEAERELGMPITKWTYNMANTCISDFRKFRQYIKFITETSRSNEDWKADFDAMVTECPVSSEEITEIEQQTEVVDTFGAELLYRRFKLRLLTQDRCVILRLNTNPPLLSSSMILAMNCAVCLV